jgi:hypothetical protein
MSQTQGHQPRHLTEPGQAGRRRRVPLGPAMAVVGSLLLVLVLVVAATRATPRAGTRSASARSQPAAASAAPRPQLSKDCRTALAAATSMASHADAAVGQLRAHKKLMDDYKSGKIDRVAALPQGSPWRQALARTLKNGAAAADRYDADKATYRQLAARCGSGG